MQYGEKTNEENQLPDQQEIDYNYNEQPKVK